MNLSGLDVSPRASSHTANKADSSSKPAIAAILCRHYRRNTDLLFEKYMDSPRFVMKSIRESSDNTDYTSTTIWNVGEVHNVTWSIDNTPPGFPIDNGAVSLGFLANDSENLDVGTL